MSAVQAAASPIARLTRFGSCALRRQTAAPRRRREPAHQGSPPVTGPDELHRQEPTAGADRPAVAHPPADGATIGEAIGGRLRYQELPPAAAEQGMIRQGLLRAVPRGPAGQVRPTGRAASAVTGQVERILGRPAHTYAEWSPTTPPRFGHPAPDPARSTRAGPWMRPGRAVSSCIREGVTRWQLKNASRC
jgi:hypothetical protein